MSIVLNCLDKEQVAVVGGKHFTFGPHQLKYFGNSEIAENIAKLRKHDGFMLLPDSLNHLGQLNKEQFEKIATPEDKEIIEEKKREGVENYCRRLRELIHNATVSLQKDLDKSNIKVDARVYMTGADVNRLRELAKYQTTKQDAEQNKLDEIKKLEKAIGSVTRG